MLVHSRLAIISPETGLQPLHSFNKRYTIVYNGEIYNYKILRNELKSDWYFQTDSDTEVVLAAYVIWGERALEKFNGMFSFFIWDSENRVGFCARDLMGIKPFCYYKKDDVFIFSSDASAISSLISDTALNDNYIWEYWACPPFNNLRETPFKNIHNLPPGHAMRIQNNEVKVSRWKDYQINPKYSDESPEFFNLLDKAVMDACESAMIADVPITSYLSGGLDSSLITAVAARFSSAFTEAYSIKFERQAAFNYEDSLIVKADDFPYAQELANFVDIQLNTVHVGQSEMINAFQQLAEINYQIPAWEQEFTHYFLAKEVSKKYKVTLVGDVADETYYGYHYMLDKGAIKSPREIIRRFSTVPLALTKQHQENLMTNIVDKLFQEVVSGGYHWEDQCSQYMATSYLIIKFWLPRLLLNADIYPMHFGLEARVPFADINLMDLAGRIAPKLAMKNNIEKYCLKQIAKNKIPESIRNRLKSSLPKNQTIGKQYQAVLKSILLDPLAEELIGHYLSRPKVHQMCLKNNEPDENERALLFKIIAFYYWYQCHN